MCIFCGKRRQPIYYGKDSDNHLKRLHDKGIIIYGGEKYLEYKSYCKNCNKVFKDIAYGNYFIWLEMYIAIGRSCFGKIS